MDNLSDNEDIEADELADLDSVSDKKQKADDRVVDQGFLHQPEKLLKTTEFKCKFCPKTFSKKYNTDRHIKRMHG